MRFFLFVFIAVLPVAAQVATGTLTGDVRDESSALAAGVAVTVRDNATGLSQTNRTDDAGAYQFPGLPPGTYTVTAVKDGFRTTTIARVLIEADRKSRLDIDLKVGSGHEAITVKANSTPVETEETSETYAVDRSTIASLPLDGRNITSLVTLGPGAIPRQLSGLVHDIINDAQEGRGAVAMNPPINGARSYMNTFLLDGTYNTDRNTYAIAVVPPFESVQEFRVQSSVGSAEFAQSGGGVVEMATKTGGQTFHGSAFEFLRNEATDAQSYFSDPALPRSVFRQNQYGASLGGPLPLHSTFFFLSYEGLRNRSAKATLHIVPDTPIRGGDFTSRNAIFDPFTLDSTGNRTPFPNNIIPASRIDPIARNFLAANEPLPNIAGNGVSNYLDDTPNTIGMDAVNGRIDHQFGSRNVLFVRYDINEDNSVLSGNFPQRPTTESLRAQQAAAGHTYTGSRWINEARLSFTRLRVFDLPQTSHGLPDYVVTNFDVVTDASFLPQTQRDNTWQVFDGISMVRGRHTIKFGGQWINFHLNYLQSQFAFGEYIFNGQYTASSLANTSNSGDPLADFLLGAAASTRRTVGNPQAYLRQNTYGAYVQDEWRITSRLTLNAGLRYEYTSPYTEARNRLLNLDYSTLPNDPRLVSVGSAGDSNPHNFAPRAGLAWRLPNFFGSRHETVFRAGYGIFFSSEIATEAYDLVRNNELIQINEANTGTPNLTLANGFPSSASTGFPTYYGLDPHARTPYVQQWSAGFQRDLGAGTVLEVSYVGSKGTDLGRFRTFNTPAHVETGEDLPPRPGDLQSLRTFPDLGPIYQRQHIANSSYNSLQIKTEKRLSGKLSFLGSFVWSKSIDDADTIIPGLSDSAGAQDERNLRLERGLSSFNVGRRLSAGFVYNFGRTRFLRPLLSNWGSSGILTFQDGSPWNPFYFGTDFANSGTPNRPNVVPGQNVNLPSSQRTAERWFNTGAFSDPAPFTFGNAGRNILPSPGNEVVDFALHRRFPIKESTIVEFRVEGFNIFNHPNWGIPGQYPDFGPFFGRIFASGEPRRLQFGLHLDF